MSFDYSDNTLKKGFDSNQKTWRKYVKKYTMQQQVYGGAAVIPVQYTRQRMGMRKYSNYKWSDITYNKPIYGGAQIVY